MDYNLAKQLKDAGFPFKEYQMAFHGTDRFDSNLQSDEDYLAIPTLEDLIEACGDGFTNLAKITKKYIGGQQYDNVNLWVCGWSSNGVNSIDDEWEQEGSTPEEAVANLYLKLKK